MKILNLTYKYIGKNTKDRKLQEFAKQYETKELIFKTRQY